MVVVVVPEPAPVLPPLVPKSKMQPVGFTEYGFAVASARAVCFICGKTTKGGAFRFEYRKNSRNAYKDPRKVHVDCIGDLPLENRATDIQTIRDWIAASLSDRDRGYLELAMELLTPSASGAASSIGGPG